MNLQKISLEDLNYLIMMISHGDDVGASLESIIAEINARHDSWVEGQPDPAQVEIDDFADAQITKSEVAKLNPEVA